MTKYVCQGHFWEGDSLYLGQESSCFLWKAKFHCGDPRKENVTDPAGHSQNLHFLLIPFNILLPPTFFLQVLRPKFS